MDPIETEFETESPDLEDEISDDISTQSILLWTLVPAVFLIFVLFIFFYWDRR